MAEITTDQIKQLRDQTGISVMQCKKALEEARGDMEKAAIILRKQGAKVAEKKSDRTLGSGVVQAYIHGGGNVGAMVEIACETDFVAKNDEFKKLAYDIAMHVAAMSPKYLKIEDVSESDRQKASDVFRAEVKDKPENIQDKILEGKLNSHFKEMVLLEQSFIKNPELTIKDLVQEAVFKFGEKAELVRFVRFEILK
ncbi:MAG: translation elongation factor Ts [bacterium]|nr:translation elongation factor Ts [bacterium]